MSTCIALRKGRAGSMRDSAIDERLYLHREPSNAAFHVAKNRSVARIWVYVVAKNTTIERAPSIPSGAAFDGLRSSSSQQHY
jgi:hypothetical protein